MKMLILTLWTERKERTQSVCLCGEGAYMLKKITGKLQTDDLIRLLFSRKLTPTKKLYLEQADMHHAWFNRALC